MTGTDAKAFAIDLGTTAEVFGVGLTASRIAAYFEALADLEITDVRSALAVLRREGRFFPRPVEIREVIEGSPEDEAHVVWQRLNQAAYTDERCPVLTRSAKAALEAVGGWRAMRTVPVAQLGRLATLFVRAYLAAERAERRTRRALPGHARNGALALPHAEAQP
jgi:hypothetical protein